MAFEYIKYEKKGRIAYVTINRSHTLNALHPPANEEMLKAFLDFRDDPNLWVAILTGSGRKAFSAGNDLKYTAEHNTNPYVYEVPFGGITRGLTLWKPVIAAINGYALGGGLELALSCDIIVAASNAKLGLPEPRVGLVAETGVHRLPRQIPLKLAMGMIMTGRHISALEAHRYGIVNEVVSPEELLPTAERWAAEILELAPLSIRASKQMAMTGLDSSIDSALTGTYSEFQKALSSDDMAEGPQAFTEKRKPNWTGH